MTGQKHRVASLDGLRGLALVLVLAYHVAPSTARGGFLGVDVFFVLSGFLLTSLLLDEHAVTGAVDKLAYAARRVRRIAPALLVLLAALVVVVPLAAPGDAHRLRGDIVSSVFGVTNWHLIRDGSSYFAQAGRPSFVRHLWSVAIEIQFYVACPFLVGWLARRRRGVAVAALCAGIAVSDTLMGVLYRSPDPSRAYFGTDTRVGALLVGCLVAVLLRGRRRETPSRMLDAAGLVPLAAVAALVVLAGERSRALYPAGFLATEAATGLLIAAALGPGLLARLLGRWQLRWLGKRSYGIYLWHWPLVVLLRPGNRTEWPTVPAALVTIAGACLLGSLSYRFVERPFLHPAPVPVHQARRAAALRLALFALSVAVVGMTLARVPTRNPLAEVLAAGEKVLAAQPVPTTSSSTTTPPPTMLAPSPPATAAPTTPPLPHPVPARPVSATAPRPPPKLNPLPPGTVPVSAIGDSVMVSAAGALHDRLGGSGYIDAKQNRYFSDAAPIVHQLRAEGALGRVVVIHLGNNGPVSSADVDSVMGELAGVPNVLLVTVRVDRSWQNEVNQTLRDAAARYASIQIVDWYGYSAGHGDWFQSDGTHFRTSSGPGTNAYADLIAGSIPPPPTTTTAPPPTTTTAPPPPPPPDTTTTAPPVLPGG